MRFPVLIGLFSMLGCMISCEMACTASIPKSQAKSHFTLWQLPPQTNSMQLSYVMKTSSGTVIVIDGGTTGDAPYLRHFLKLHGNKVDAWFITHAHDDHFCALQAILANPEGLQIEKIYGDLSSEEWVSKYEKSEVKPLIDFNHQLKESGRTVIPLKLGEIFDFDGVKIEVLGVSNPEITSNAINNSSMVLRAEDSKKSVLFLGDLGVEGGEKLLHGPYASKIHADYVQMAHHGQNGASEDFYQAVKPSYCLWPTTWWIWDNNNGTGYNTANLRTLEVRAWMQKLNIKRHYVAFRGLFEIQ